MNRRANATAEYRYPVWGKAADANLFPSKFAYSHSGFYKASMVKDCDIFRCVEDGQLYVPSGDGLRHYNERPDPERGRKYER